ncbi:hypothetical protein TNCV_3157631 [Trichonephila clavipes]|nr:hypothetical protein TNCV_3157631 [Trichonephila clavipes]
MKEGCGWQNRMKLSLLTSHRSVCNTTMVGFESGDNVQRGCVTARICTTTLVLHWVLWYGAVLDITFTLFLYALPIAPPGATPDNLWQRVEAVWSDVPQEHIQSLFESMPRRLAAMISNTVY